MFIRLRGTSYLWPFVLLFVIFGLFPLIYSGYVSLTSTNLYTPDQLTFVGGENYSKILQDDYFWNALRNTLTLGFLAIVPQLFIALGVANLLNYTLKLSTFWRVAIFLPYATSVAASTLIFAQLYSKQYGFVNNLLGHIGLPPVDWQAGHWSSQIAIASIVTWRWVGYNSLIYLASMQSISNDLYEAAEIDGASRWRQFLTITVPGIRPTILFTAVVSTIGAMQLFVEPLLYEGGNTGVQGGVSRQYQTLTLYLYQQGFSFSHLGYASAIAFSILALIVLALAIGFGLARASRTVRGAA
ncbi:sugar ABC transporter permease [Actinoplanes bogorensis]|uniref:Sugar ABC transporter permease n=1 Tax=Paractinoplanes bogorensis TaxID=1610840 RepID=A0ABS5YJH1_9ACTN|nr:sugar ABC transporter permease [Actinoplanes bogorensis]MBU2663626.1 sugar ABC transporter permease [Actinoplanes bogorensis]